MAILLVGQNTGDDVSLADTWIAEDDPTAINSASAVGYLGTYYTKDQRILLLPGSLSALSGATINSVTLYLWQSAVGANVSTQNVNIHQLIPSVVIAEASWNNYATGSAWNAGGANTSGTDYTATASDVADPGTGTGAYVGFTDAQMATDIASWASGTPLGWVVFQTDGTGDVQTRTITLSEGTDGNRPYISIDYTAGGGGSSAKHNLLLGVG